MGVRGKANWRAQRASAWRLRDDGRTRVIPFPSERGDSNDAAVQGWAKNIFIIAPVPVGCKSTCSAEQKAAGWCGSYTSSVTSASSPRMSMT
jgi:hypothetical protein